MEFLRFGSSIPGAYWGCCACDIIQDMKQDPDTKMSCSLVGGDSGSPLGDKYVGMTYREIFYSRLRINTFNLQDKPNHAFFCIMTAQQIGGGVGAKWLKILKEAGFEFIRTVSNAVYTGEDVMSYFDQAGDSHDNYIFGLFLNIGNGAVKDPYKAPSAWTSLPDPYEKDMSPENMFKVQKKLWQKWGPAKIYTRAQLVAANVPVWLAGIRPKFLQQPEETRKKFQEAESKAKASNPDPFGKATKAEGCTAQPVKAA